MAQYDVVIVGGGFGGCVAAALLAKEGKKVVLLEKNDELGGRVRSARYEGYTINTGPHLVEDSGSGIMRMYEYLGKKLEEGPKNDAMPVYLDGKWKHVGEISKRTKKDKESLVAIIQELIATDFSEFDKYDHLPLRTWLKERNATEGVIALFEFEAMLEQLTDEWWDHSASENLYVRKMHYEEKRMAGYSYWPEGGYDQMLDQLRDAIVENKGEIRMETEVSQVKIENHEVQGVYAHPTGWDVYSEYRYGQLLEAPIVISTLPVWSVLNIVDRKALPGWYVDQIYHIGQEDNKACWIGIHAASDEPIVAKSERELTAWFKTPRTGLPGFSFSNSCLDPSVAPEGKHLFTSGFACKASQIRNRTWLRQMFKNVEADLEDMFEPFKRTIWRKPYTVIDPAFGIFGQPGLCGRYRPDFIAPNIEGLYFVSDTFRGRGIGIDKVARTALSCVDRITGTKIPFLKDTWRY